MAEAWVINASPVITLAKAGYLHLLDQLSKEILIPGPVVDEILAGPPADPSPVHGQVAFPGQEGYSPLPLIRSY